MSTVLPAPPSIEQIRSQFPALAKPLAFFENAGGSQLPKSVIDAMTRYMTDCYVQLGAPYAISEEATAIVGEAHDWVNRLMGGEGKGMVVLGPSSTQLATMLAECYSRVLQPGDEIIVNETGHEANIGPWIKLQRFGIVVKYWSPINRRGETPIEDLKDLLTPRTKLVTFPHVSNLLGAVLDVKEITDVCHAAGAKVVVDGVAYAAHRPVDVAAWGADWYFYSTYKVYGPHMGALFGTNEAFAELSGPNHFFLPEGDAYKFELGGASHEGCAGLVGLKDYVRFLSGSPEASRDASVRAFSLMGARELQLQERLLGFLNDWGAEIIGPETAGEERVPTIGFLHTRFELNRIVEGAVNAGVAMRSGHMYAYRMCERLGIDTATGVARVSMLHYNTLEEVDRLIAAWSAMS